MTTHVRTGLGRLIGLTVLVTAAYGLVSTWLWAPLVDFLHWVEGLSETHGLSGFVFLVLAPFAFLAACFGFEWIRAGFTGRPPAYAAPKPDA